MKAESLDNDYWFVLLLLMGGCIYGAWLLGAIFGMTDKK